MSQYKKGLTNVTSGSAIVTGSGTAFLNNVSAGDGFVKAGHPVVYTIASVDSDTQITLGTTFQGATASGTTYTIHTGFTATWNLPEITNGDIETGTLLTRLARKVEQALNSTIEASALSGAGIYANTTDGLAATASGDYFYVVDVDELVLYLDNTGVAVEQLRFASLSLVQSLSASLTTAVDNAEGWAANAEVSATNASESASEAAASEAASGVFASSSEGSAATASTQASAAATSASAASTSAGAALDSELEAGEAADIAVSVANFKGRWSDLTGSLTVPASVYHDGDYYQLLENIADVTLDEPPSANWADIAVQLSVGFGTPVHLTGSVTYVLPNDRAAGDIYRFTRISAISPLIDTDGVQEIVTSGGNITSLEYDVMMELVFSFDGTDWHLLDS